MQAWKHVIGARRRFYSNRIAIMKGWAYKRLEGRSPIALLGFSLVGLFGSLSATDRGRQDVQTSCKCPS